MRIDGFQNIPAILHMLKDAHTSRANVASEEGRDSSSVNLSSFGTILQSVQRDAASKIKAREAKIDGIAEAVRDGSLKVDHEKLAARMVDMQIIDFQR